MSSRLRKSTSPWRNNVVTGSRFSSLVVGRFVPAPARQPSLPRQRRGMKIELDFLFSPFWPSGPVAEGVAWTLGLRALSAVLGAYR